MIRQRLVALDVAVGRATEILRAAQRIDVHAALQVIARAANSERAAYWSVDLELLQLRPIATWSVIAPEASGLPCDTHRSATPLCRANAVRVWRSRKPLWSASIGLGAVARPSGAAALRGGVWFAVKTDTFVYGVMELIGRALDAVAPDNLRLLEPLGFRLGQALEELRYADARLHRGRARST